VLRVTVEQEARREGLPQLPSPLEKGDREAVDEENEFFNSIGFLLPSNIFLCTTITIKNMFPTPKPSAKT
jgi:hypothetical protein